MHTPEQQSKEPAKRRVRLAAPKKQLERTIQKMTKLSETAMKPEKLVDLLIWMGRLQIRLLDMDRDAIDAKKDALIDENERLKSELAARPMKDSLDDEAQRMLDRQNREHLEKLQNEVAKLRLQSASLLAENTELTKTSNGLKSANSQLGEQVQSLEGKNAELQLAIKTLESRTPQQLIDEARSKWDATAHEAR